MTSGDANIGVSTTQGPDVYSVMADASVVSVEGDRNRNVVGFAGQWQRNLDARNQVSVFAKYSNLHYRGQDSRDADRWMLGGTYAHVFRDGVVGFAQGYVVNERPQLATAPWLGFMGAGFRVGGRMNYDPQTVLFGTVAYEVRRHDVSDPSFLVTRRDNQYGLILGATHNLSKDWSVTPQLTLTRNDSNTELNEYHREMFSVTIRREF